MHLPPTSHLDQSRQNFLQLILGRQPNIWEEIGGVARDASARLFLVAELLTFVVISQECGVFWDLLFASSFLARKSPAIHRFDSPPLERSLNEMQIELKFNYKAMAKVFAVVSQVLRASGSIHEIN